MPLSCTHLLLDELCKPGSVHGVGVGLQLTQLHCKRQHGHQLGYIATWNLRGAEEGGTLRNANMATSYLGGRGAGQGT